MSTESDPPVERFLDMPDLVGTVFERLDPASRRAFFQSHPHVAHAGPVLAQSKLYIELSPTSSLEDQWQHLLELTRCQPLRSLILAGPSKEHISCFLHCVPEGRQEEKLRVLQGTSLQLQVLVRLDNGGASQLQRCLGSWREEQQHEAQGAISRLVLDLCGRELHAMNEGDLEPPSCCTLQNGTLLLLGTSCVSVAACDVHFTALTIKGEDEQDHVVELVGGGSLEMEGWSSPRLAHPKYGQLQFQAPNALLFRI